MLCVVVVSLGENEIRNLKQPIVNTLEKVCHTFGTGNGFQKWCSTFVKALGPSILELILRKEDATKVCQQLKMCKMCHLTESNQDLSLMASSRNMTAVDLQNGAEVLAGLLYLQKLDLGAQAEKKTMGSLIGDLFGTYKPYVDVDKDGYSPVVLHRGAHWRGRDCWDIDRKIHPGQVPAPDALVDSNCNGIHGKNSHGHSYETQFCEGSDMRGLVTFGDSASSGFHLAEDWIYIKDLKSLLPSLLDEIDRPQLSWDSGFMSSIRGESVYLKMLANNRCNHRQFSNLGHNGAQMKDLSEQVSLLKSSSHSLPFLAFVAYIGNDVCQDSLDMMTTPETYRQQLLQGLQELDAIAPPNSKVVLMGLVDGRILWDSLYNRRHPLGSTYEQFWNFLTCTGSNPCATWLTADEATRNATTHRAMELSSVLEEVAKAQGYTNLELSYEEFPLAEALDELKKEGKDPAELIEPVDGFHPGEYGHRLLARIIWDHITQKTPHFVSAVNPHNQDIQNIFGDQGGY